jgi:putative ABC transport system permease protein
VRSSAVEMLGLILANIRRRSARTLLTAAGIAVGVAAVVALLALSAGLDNTAAEFAHLGKADLGVFQSDAGDLTSSVLPLSLQARLARQPEIAKVTPIQLVIGAIARSPGAIVLGLQRNGFAARQLVLIRGQLFSPGRVDVGDQLASQLHLSPGSTLRLGHHRFPVAGVYHTGLSYEDSGAITTLADAQRLAGRTPQEVTAFGVDLAPQASARSAVREIEHTFPGVTAIADPGEAVRADPNTALISKAVLMVVVLALIIGSLAVANTMLAALLERRRELALLATIGWSAPQLGLLMLGEALTVSLIGTAVGIGLGLAASEGLPSALGLSGFVSPSLTAWAVGRALIIGTVIGTVGSLYPIWRVTRMRSVVALALT